MAKKQGKSAIASRAIIAALVSAKATDTEERIRQLTSILADRGIEVVGSIVQRRGVSRGGVKRMTAPMNSATFLGSGKVKELSVLVKEHSATVVYCLNDLSAIQVERLSALIGCEVVSYPKID